MRQLTSAERGLGQNPEPARPARRRSKGAWLGRGWGGASAWNGGEGRGRVPPAVEQVGAGGRAPLAGRGLRPVQFAVTECRLLASATAERGRARGGVLSPGLGFSSLIERSGFWGGSRSAFDSSLLHSRRRVQWVRKPVAPLSARPRPPVALALAPAMKRIFSCSSSQVAVGAEISETTGMGLGSEPCGDRSPASRSHIPLPLLFIGLSSSSTFAMQPASPAFLKTLSPGLWLPRGPFPWPSPPTSDMFPAAPVPS